MYLTMVEDLKKVLSFISHFDDATLRVVTQCFRQKTVKKSEVIFTEGAVCKEFFYVHSGCLRTYFITPNGEEKTRYVMHAHSIGTALTSFILQQPSAEVLGTLVDSELLAISHHDFYRLQTEIPGWAAFYQKILEMAYVFQNKRIESVIALTAKERYEQLLRENPSLIQILPNKVLASYLDMRQETLSRLKSI